MQQHNSQPHTAACYSGWCDVLLLHAATQTSLIGNLSVGGAVRAKLWRQQHRWGPAAGGAAPGGGGGGRRGGDGSASTLPTLRSTPKPILPHDALPATSTLACVIAPTTSLKKKGSTRTMGKVRSSTITESTPTHGEAQQEWCSLLDGSLSRTQ